MACVNKGGPYTYVYKGAAAIHVCSQRGPPPSHRGRHVPLKSHLDSAHDDGAVGVLQARGDALDDAFGLAAVHGSVLGEGVEDEDLAPLRALVERGEELLEDGGGDLGASV